MTNTLSAVPICLPHLWFLLPPVVLHKQGPVIAPWHRWAPQTGCRSGGGAGGAAQVPLQRGGLAALGVCVQRVLPGAEPRRPRAGVHSQADHSDLVAGAQPQHSGTPAAVPSVWGSEDQLYKERGP